MSGLPSKTVRNERLKLRASALNSVAVASVVAGFVSPLVAVSFGLPTPTSGIGLATVAISLAWLTGGLLLHLAANVVLGGLSE